MIKNIGVLGAGQMGNGIAHVFAQYGYQVVLYDIAEEQLEKAVTSGRIWSGRPRRGSFRRHWSAKPWGGS